LSGSFSLKITSFEVIQGAHLKWNTLYRYWPGRIRLSCAVYFYSKAQRLQTSVYSPQSTSSFILVIHLKFCGIACVGRMWFSIYIYINNAFCRHIISAVTELRTTVELRQSKVRLILCEEKWKGFLASLGTTQYQVASHPE